jgi:hypothetical protein
MAQEKGVEAQTSKNAQDDALATKKVTSLVVGDSATGWTEDARWQRPAVGCKEKPPGIRCQRDQGGSG